VNASLKRLPPHFVVALEEILDVMPGTSGAPKLSTAWISASTGALAAIPGDAALQAKIFRKWLLNPGPRWAFL
jgi:hypothetical protein